MRGRLGLLALEVPTDRRGDDGGQRHATTAFAALRLAFLKAKLSDATYLALHLEGPRIEVDVRPAQGEQFALAQAQTGADGHPVQRVEPIAGGSG